MSKINQEEYEVLKALDSRAKSIVRQDRGWLWVAEQPMMKDHIGWYVADGFDEVLKDDNLFQFIQWEDEEPHNIAELIEEYEIENGMRYDFGKIKVVDIDTSKLATHNGYIYVKESEETEVKKDKKWLKKEIGELPCVDTVFNSGGSSYIDSAVPVMAVYDLIDKLDEPEVLSQEWIDKHAVAVSYDGIPDQTEIVYVDELKNLIVPKQELPVIPQWVADGIESKKRAGKRLNLAMSEFPESKLRKELGIDEHECNEIYARAWLDGYVVEEEPLYYALIKGHELVDDYDVYWNYHKSNHDVFVSRLHPPLDNFTTEMTKQEWFEIGITDSNADFVNVVQGNG